MAENPFARQPRSLRERVRPIFAIVAATFRADPWRASLSLGLRVIAGAASPFIAVLVARLVEEAHPGADGGRIATIAVLLALAVGCSALLAEIGWRFFAILQDRTSHYLDRQIVGMVGGIPGVEHFERPEHLDKVDRLREEQWLLGQSLDALAWAFVNYSQIAITLVLLATVDSRLVLLPLFAIPSVLAGIKAERIRYAYLTAHQGDFRQWVDLLRLGTEDENKEEIRIFGLRHELRRRHDVLIDRIPGWETEHRLKGAYLTTAANAFFALAYVGGVLLVARQVADGRLSTGALAMTVVLSGQLLNMVTWITGNANWVAWTFTAVRRWLWLLDYSASQRGHANGSPIPAPRAMANGIHFEGVTFRYPGTDVDVLSGVDLFLPAGSTVAIVGDNGAGKTTLVKLLSRFYEPTSGLITVDGVPLNAIDVEDWRTRLSAAFQDHVPFEFTAAETVTFGDLARLGDHDAARTALEAAGSDELITELPEGLDTQLGAQWPDGIDLSGGQWQKLSLGRAMMRDDPLVLLLDEPTAALDAETEHRLFERYAARARDAGRRSGTITILVSHRFSTVRTADLIVVVAAGGIAEIGSHAELMGADGIYSELYGLQARAYR